jgi:hypothetical protein
MRVIAILGLMLTVSACAGAGADGGLDLMSGGVARGKALEARLKTAALSPLGSRDNPVRANMPDGQRAYLARLRCGDGAPPAFERMGSYGPGPFGSIIDGYRVTCAVAELKVREVFMDMYHPGHIEPAAVPGFAIVPPTAVKP